MLFKKSKISCGGQIVGVLVVSFVGPILSNSEGFIDFAHSLGIDSNFWIKLLSAIIALLMGALAMILMSRLSKLQS